MARPKAVRDAAELAEQQINELNQQPEQEQPEQEQPELQVVAPEQEQPEQPEQEQVDWEHKYKTLQGMYRQEKTLAEQAREDAERAQQVLAAVNAPRSREETFETPTLVTQEELEEYGQDFVDMVQRAARQAVAPELHDLKQRSQYAEHVFQEVSQTTAANAKQRLYAHMDANLPEWKEINSSEQFINWLTNIDPYSGSTRKQMLMQAFEAADASRVLAFFKGYMRESEQLSPPETPQARTPSASLETLVAPGQPHGASVAQQDQGTKRIWTQSQIATFYKEVQLGKWKERPQDKAAIERDIIDAANENRIR